LAAGSLYKDSLPTTPLEPMDESQWKSDDEPTLQLAIPIISHQHVVSLVYNDLKVKF
jgi:hypothetical protein